MSRMCKITVLKTTVNDDLIREYGAPGMGPCDAMTPGMTFITDFKKPDAMCNEAWSAMSHYVFALYHGQANFFNGTWVNNPDIAICSCNDGLRPVIFKIEAIEQ